MITVTVAVVLVVVAVAVVDLDEKVHDGALFGGAFLGRMSSEVEMTTRRRETAVVGGRRDGFVGNGCL